MKRSTRFILFSPLTNTGPKYFTAYGLLSALVFLHDNIDIGGLFVSTKFIQLPHTWWMDMSNEM